MTVCWAPKRLKRTPCVRDDTERMLRIAMNAAPPQGPALDRRTLLKVVSAIERRIADLDRLGPPNAPGHTCAACKDGELHRLLGVLRGLVGPTD